jgi:hypothetical protein
MLMSHAQAQVVARAQRPKPSEIQINVFQVQSLGN